MSEGIPALIAATIGTTKTQVSRWIAAGMPADSVEAAVAWARVNRPKYFSTKLDDTLDAADTTDAGPRGAYARARALEKRIYELAMEEPTSQNILAHSKAAASAESLAEQVAAWELKAGTTAEVETIKGDFIRWYSVMRAELDGMPVRQGEKIAPHAEPILREWKDRFLTRLERVFPFGDAEPEELIDDNG